MGFDRLKEHSKRSELSVIYINLNRKFKIMYSGLLVTHSYLRYFILVLLIIVIVISVVGLVGKKPYTRRHDKVNLFLFICAHTQLLLGLILYIIGLSGNGRAQFNADTMKNPQLRYFAVEHAFAMLIVIALITIARISTKKIAVDQAKHKRMVIFNSLAFLIVIVVVFVMGKNYNMY